MAGGHGIGALGLQSKVAHRVVVDAHEHRHLIQEGSGASGAVAVHAQLGVSAVEEDHLGIFSTDVYQSLGFRMSRLCEDRCGHNLLYELRLQLLGGRHADAAGDAEVYVEVSELFDEVVEVGRYELSHGGVMPLIS